MTGVGRTAGIARELAASGWNLALTYWTAYHQRVPWGGEADL